jgi:magnesium transporter
MLSIRTLSDHIWADLSSPTKDEVDSVILSQNIDPLIGKDLLTPTPKPQVKIGPDYIYSVMYIPVFRHSHSEGTSQEIDFVIQKNTLTTARYDSVDAMHHFAKQLEVESILNRVEEEHLFFGLMREIYKTITDEILYTEDWLSEVEKNIFTGKEKEMVFSISNIGRNLLNFKRAIDPHGRVFEVLKETGGDKFGESFKYGAEALHEEWRRVMRAVNNMIDLVNEIRETNNAMLSTKQNEIMKIFTILAFVTFPLSLIAAIFGMNASYIPIIGMAYDFWIIMAIMLAMSIAMYSYFKYKRWI